MVNNNIKDIKITAFYKIFKLSQEDANTLLIDIKNLMSSNNIKGTVLLGYNEGINGTVAGSHDGIRAFHNFFNNHTVLKNTGFKQSYHDSNPFDKIKVKLKKEIVTMRIYEEFDFTGVKGNYIKPEEWDSFISRNDVVNIDTRNDYEYQIGTFEGAFNPDIDSFRQLPEWLKINKHIYEGKKLATFCTGGIRCEKLTAYLVQAGIKETYHLEGGILDYFEKTGNKNKKWVGHCFVFDNRIAVDDQLEAI